jgi:hypothetical protein
MEWSPTLALLMPFRKGATIPLKRYNPATLAVTWKTKDYSQTLNKQGYF